MGQTPGAAEEYRKRAVITAALAAILGVIPTLPAARAHHWIVFVCIAVQVLLITVAIAMLTRMRKAKRGSC